MWTSLHLYFPLDLDRGDDCYGAEIDRLLVECVRPLAEDLLSAGEIDRFFFIRYSEGGSHVRWRLHAPAGQTSDRLEALVRRRIADLHGLRSEAGRTDTATSSGPARCPEIKSVAYEPEWQRYGGVAGVAAAERLFQVSSEIALQVLAATSEELPEKLSAGPPPSETPSRLRQRRLGKALLLAVVLAQAFFDHRDTAREFLRRYSEAYSRIVEKVAADATALRRQLTSTEGQSLDAISDAVEPLLCALEKGRVTGIDLLDRWHRACRRCRSSVGAAGLEQEALEPRIASYLHMHHNRLGLSIPQEVHLTHLAASCLERLGVYS